MGYGKFSFNIQNYTINKLFCYFLLFAWRHISDAYRRRIPKQHSMASFTEGFYTAAIQRDDICFTRGRESIFIEQLFPKQKLTRVHIIIISVNLIFLPDIISHLGNHFCGQTWWEWRKQRGIKKMAELWAAMVCQQVKIWELFEIIIENK